MTFDAHGDDLALALGLATEVSELALKYLRRGPEIRIKADQTPVTNADLTIERRIIELLNERRPADAVFGEEYGMSGAGASDRRWIIDPIDGTANFVAGKPQWGTNIALQVAGEIVVGVITRPSRAMAWYASKGQGAFCRQLGSNEIRRLGVSETDALATSRVNLWASESDPRFSLIKASARLMNPDMDAILMLAEGEMEAVVDPLGKPWDHAPATVLVREAGGRFSDSHGGSRIDLGEVRYTNGRIHKQLESVLNNREPSQSTTSRSTER